MIVVAVADPANVIALDDIRTTTGRELDVLVGAPRGRSTRSSGVSTSSTGRPRRCSRRPPRLQTTTTPKHEIKADEAPIVKAINRIITRAVQQRASDIHIEPQQRDVRIRFRIDGVLSDAMHTKRSLHGGIVSRLKVMADLDIAERRVPQDGRSRSRSSGARSTCASRRCRPAGERRSCSGSWTTAQACVTSSELGFEDQALTIYREVIARPYGAVLITGPTGSGKTTTLYATLEAINDVSTEHRHRRGPGRGAHHGSEPDPGQSRRPE